MSLRQEIENFMTQFLTQVPQDIQKVMQEEAERLAHSGLREKTLKVGDKAPAFSLPNLQGTMVSSRDLLTKGPLVVSFYRGGWCPYCSLELRAWQLAVADVESLGAHLVAISPQVPEKSLDTARQNVLTFEVLSDVGNKVARQFGLVFTLPERLRVIYRQFGADVPAANGDECYELPVAATYVIGSDGIITHAFVDTDYTKRDEPEEVVLLLKKMVNSG